MKQNVSRTLTSFQNTKLGSKVTYTQGKNFKTIYRQMNLRNVNNSSIFCRKNKRNGTRIYMSKKQQSKLGRNKISVAGFNKMQKPLNCRRCSRWYVSQIFAVRQAIIGVQSYVRTYAFGISLAQTVIKLYQNCWFISCYSRLLYHIQGRI